MQVKLKKYYLIFLVLYLIALILLGANRMGPYPTSGGFPQNAVLKKAAVFIWGLMPSQTVGWWTISGLVLVILIILGFVAGCKLIAFASRYKMIVFVSDKVRVHFMRKEKDQPRE